MIMRIRMVRATAAPPKMIRHFREHIQKFWFSIIFSMVSEFFLKS